MGTSGKKGKMVSVVDFQESENFLNAVLPRLNQFD